MKHQLWLWLWFGVGALLFVLNRGFYMIKGSNHSIAGWRQYFATYWTPLLFRAAIDSAWFWLCFTPGVMDKGLTYMGWSNWSWVVTMVTQFAPMAFLFGLFVDVLDDFLFGNIVSRIPLLKNFWPQINGQSQAPAQP